MSNGDRWMPLYVADYLGDTMHLTGPEHGAYLLLLMHYWRNGPLPDDDRKLAHIARTDSVLWKSVGPVIREFFTTNGDGTLRQKRMDWELRRWGEISGKRRDAGKRGAEAKHRPHPSNGSGPVVTPLPAAGKHPGKTLANAKQMPDQPTVDNLANATSLPGGNVANAKQMPELCHDFASVPVPVQKKESSLLSKSSTPREGKTPETGQDLPLPADHLELILRESLDSADAAHKGGLMSQRRHSLDEQRQSVAKPPRAKACPLDGAILYAARKQAGIRHAADA